MRVFDAQGEFAELPEGCEDGNRNLDFEIKTGIAQIVREDTDGQHHHSQCGGF